MGRPTAEIEIDEALVQDLLRSQYPSVCNLPIRRMDSGWDNQLFRLGESLTVRLPRRHIAAQLIETEQIWLPILSARLPIPVPSPIYCGKPSDRYPWSWSVLPWIEGVSAYVETPSIGESERFAAFLRSLHVPAPSSVPFNPFRSVSLASRSAQITAWMQQLDQTTSLITPTIKAIWKSAINPKLTFEPQWIHGDLHPQNVLVNQGKISGVIDWGDMTVGDPALDLAAIWMIFPQPSERQQLLRHYDATPSLIQCAKGWAVFFATVFSTHGDADDPVQVQMGQRIFQNLEQDEE
ncbi:Phosphotransferase enzyme family, putative [Synechococcus sp. PCC 7335]|uniref:aminoglycoside phosphotransferase family protein n=1 Tax=Synechococcus sp. (strain ATCC 29403 / PCC 7335) TaxID=91464 RepID=UPI00017EB890|nr:aminoglycoside phosphotransferase family protein [Synechococcus sp. PCC 7335]EDX84805.1 Phosphotransferase enzyme family, putative [Synechococcus sp. PCC 7335]